MKRSLASLRVRYGETDRMGFVYYANYIAWFEVGRSTLLKEAGYPYSKLEEDGCILPVVETYCKYRVPAGYDDELVIETWLTRLTKRDLTFSYEIKRGSQLLAEGYSRHFPVDSQGKRVVVPPRLLGLLRSYCAV